MSLRGQSSVGLLMGVAVSAAVAAATASLINESLQKNRFARAQVELDTLHSARLRVLRGMPILGTSSLLQRIAQASTPEFQQCLVGKGSNCRLQFHQQEQVIDAALFTDVNRTQLAFQGDAGPDGKACSSSCAFSGRLTYKMRCSDSVLCESGEVILESRSAASAPRSVPLAPRISHLPLVNSLASNLPKCPDGKFLTAYNRVSGDFNCDDLSMDLSVAQFPVRSTASACNGAAEFLGLQSFGADGANFCTSNLRLTFDPVLHEVPDEQIEEISEARAKPWVNIYLILDQTETMRPALAKLSAGLKAMLQEVKNRTNGFNVRIYAWGLQTGVIKMTGEATYEPTADEKALSLATGSSLGEYSRINWYHSDELLSRVIANSKGVSYFAAPHRYTQQFHDGVSIGFDPTGLEAYSAQFEYFIRDPFAASEIKESDNFGQSIDAFTQRLVNQTTTNAGSVERGLATMGYVLDRNQARARPEGGLSHDGDYAALYNSADYSIFLIASDEDDQSISSSVGPAVDHLTKADIDYEVDGYFVNIVSVKNQP